MTIPPLTVSPRVLVRKPRFEVYIAGVRVPYVLEVTTTRGLDQEVATADITYPFPLPVEAKMWARVSILMSAEDPGSLAPHLGLVERFNGFVMAYNDSLWPGACVIHCESKLAMAKWTFTPVEMDLKDETDITAVIRILGPPEGEQGGCNIYASTTDIQGLNLLLTDFDDVQLFWEVGQTALAAIQMIDSASQGFRTFDTAGGHVMRRFINTDPNTEGYVWWFKEGVDILEGSASTEIKSPVNEIEVTGWSEKWRASLADDQDPFYWRMNAYWIRYMWLKSNISGGTLNPTDVALYILSQLSKNIIKLTFTTHLDVLFQGMEVIKVTSARLNGADQHFWVQSVQTTVAADGSFSQTITCVSELVRDKQRPTVTPPGITPPTITPGSVVPYTELALAVAPAAADILVDFTIVSIERELATPASIPGNSGFTYTVTFSDNSTSRMGTITTRAWEIGGSGVTAVIPTGDGQTFTTSFTPLEGATITLTVTDSNSQTASLTRLIDDGSVPITTRKLYACTDTTYEAFDGNEWRSLAPVAVGGVQVVAGGPWWGAGNRVAYSADDLVTPPVEVVAFTDQNVTAIWKHESVAGDVAIGGASGGVSVSHDYGATWNQGSSLASQVNFIIASIFDATEIHAITPDGWFKSQNSGETWDLVRAGSFKYLELSHTRNIIVTTAGVLQRAEDGTPFTGNTSPIVAATAHIRKDTFYAIAADGTTWIQDTEGSYTLIPGEPIPAGSPYDAGAYRDGTVVDLVYFAAQEGGLFKTLDGFRTPEGYMRLRADGEITP
jgi:hypothetical protein